MRKLAGTETFAKPVARCREVFGIGFFTAAAFVALLGGNVERFAKARDVGPYLGLVPRQDQSGEIDRQCAITRAGCSFMRSMLTECAQVALKASAVPSDLRLKARRICASGGPKAKKRAVTAVARGLAVMMLALLKTFGARAWGRKPLPQKTVPFASRDSVFYPKGHCLFAKGQCLFPRTTVPTLDPVAGNSSSA